jgi:hypothetical protein
MDKRNIIGGGIFLLLAIMVIISSLALGIGELHNPGPGFFPFWIGFLLGFLAFCLIGICLIKKNTPSSLARLWQGLDWHKNVIVVAALLIYGLMLPKAGYILATLALMIILFYVGKMKVRHVVLASVAAVLFSYGLFHFLLKAPLPKGILDF